MSRCNDTLHSGEMLVRLSAVIAVLFAAHPAAAQGWKPARNVEIVAVAGAGGSADRGARVPQKFFSALPGIPSVTVSNRVGGGGVVAWTYMAQHPNDPHYLATLSPSLLTNQIVGNSQLSHRDFTPEQIAYWDQAFVKVTQTDDWKQDLQSNAWTEDYRGPAETRKHLDAEFEMLKTLLVELGVVGSK